MSDDYIHGFTRWEQRRLMEQAEILAPSVFAGLDFSNVSTLLEIGCAVGAELSVLRQRWPHLQLTGLDRSAPHLAAARDLLGHEIKRRTVTLVLGDGYALPFSAHKFDCVTTIWMLEHVADPRRIICNARRVLKPDGTLICIEVDNDTFRFDPVSDVIADWWYRFNSYQESAGGDPFIGKKLKDIAEQAGCRHIQAERAHVIDSRREPQRRGVLLEYLANLLLSGADSMIKGGFADESDAARLRAEFDRLRSDDAVDFRYYATRLTCQP